MSELPSKAEVALRSCDVAKVRPQLTAMPGGFSPVYARIAEIAGLESFFLAGSQMSAYLLGVPDTGIVGLRDIVDHARHVAARTEIPILLGLDTGFGNAVNVHFSVQECIRAGVAGVLIEDQEAPKKSATVAGRRCISREEAIGKYRAAIAARDALDPSFVICARCDVCGRRQLRGGAGALDCLCEHGSSSFCLCSPHRPPPGRSMPATSHRLTPAWSSARSRRCRQVPCRGRRADRQSARGACRRAQWLPGPLHVLELAPQLRLTDEQLARVRAVFAAVKAEAVPIGEQLIAQEAELDCLFAGKTITADSLVAATGAIGQTQAALRAAHLKYHLATLDVLTAAQAARYSELRGYTVAQPPAPHGHHPR